MTATDLVKVVDAKNSLCYKLAEENKVLEEFYSRKRTYSDLKINRK